MNERDRERLLSENDPLLAEFIGAGNADAREDALAAVHIECVEPIARRVLSRYRSMTKEDSDDVVATVHLRIARKLQALLAFEEEPVARLGDYAATLTFNTIYDHLRRAFPERTRLKNKARHIVTNDRRLAAWNIDGASVCGLRGWIGRTDTAPTGALDPHSMGHGSPADEIFELLTRVGRPIAVDDLVACLAVAWNISDVPRPTRAEPHQPSHAARIETRQYLTVLWKEILQLRPNQRAALLLNLRDTEGSNAITHLVLVGIATLDEVAAALGMSAEGLAARWNDLPLDDVTIGGILGVQRQNVVNLRKAARERLARRMPAKI